VSGSLYCGDSLEIISQNWAHRMAKNPKDVDRGVLNVGAARWADDPEEALTASELDRVLSYFNESKRADDPDLRRSLGWQFQTFVANVVRERFIEVDGKLQNVSKPSTRIEHDIKKLNKASDALYQQFSKLDAVSKTWLGQYLLASDPSSTGSAHQKFRELDDRILYLAQDLALAVRAVDGQVAPGPNNVALRCMIEELAACWKICYGEPPTTDKGRGRRDDPFLELCQEVAGMAQSKLKAKGGNLGTRQLSGLVADVLQKQRQNSPS